MAQAMGDSGLPYIISFMIRGNGRLLDGTTINDAIQSIDASVEVQPACYMTNCVHPAVLYEALSQPFNATEVVRERFLWHPGQRFPPDPGSSTTPLTSNPRSRACWRTTWSVCATR